MVKKTEKKAVNKVAKKKKAIIVKLDMSFDEAIDLALHTPIKKKTAKK
ncbi:MAG: hypothetical protein ABI402_01715 [Ferruginibacter sp.]